MEKIAISVIIPVYNVEKYLEECLESVITQDIRELEIICINDGSTDGSQEILNAYAKKDNRIVIVNQKNQGLSCARNAGIDCARGEYLFFLDSDDCLAEHALKKLYSSAQEENVEILTFDAECFYETEELRKREYKDNYYRKKREYARVCTGEELFCEFMENDDFCDGACILFISRSWLDRIGIRFTPGILHEDCLFSFQCYMKAKKMNHKKWECLRYRIREDSIMTSKPSFSSLLGRLVCYKEILGFLLNHGLPERLEAAVSKYLEFIVYNIKYTDFALEDTQKEPVEILPVVDRLLMNSLGVGKAGRYTMNADIYELGFETLICNYERVILYGAGKIGRIVWNYFKQKNVSKKVLGFAVSEKNTNSEDKIEGIEIRKINEYKADDNTLVLITARWDYQTDMIKCAKEAGFNRIKAVDFRLEQSIQYMKGCE